MSDISGGSWQFASLKNKSFYGYTEYERTIYKRFDKALKNAIKTDWKIEDITKENIYEFEFDLIKLFKERKFSLADEEGIDRSDLGFIWSYKKDKTQEEMGVKRITQHRELKSFFKGEDLYRDFCFKYADKPLEELINDILFCADVTKIKKSYSNSVSILESITDPLAAKDFSFANFNILLNSNEDVVFELLNSYYVDKLLETYPIQFETLSILETFKNKANAIIEKEVKKEKDYNSKKMIENFQKILTADYNQLKENKKAEVNKLQAKAKENFVKTWNELIPRCWYKNTNEQLQTLLKKLKKNLSTNTFTLEEVRDECENDFSIIISHHRNQYKKNQSAIKKAFKELMNDYTILFCEKSIDELCEYFGFKKPEIPKPIIKKVKKEMTKTSLFDFAS